MFRVITLFIILTKPLIFNISKLKICFIDYILAIIQYVTSNMDLLYDSDSLTAFFPPLSIFYQQPRKVTLPLLEGRKKRYILFTKDKIEKSVAFK